MQATFTANLTSVPPAAPGKSSSPSSVSADTGRDKTTNSGSTDGAQNFPDVLKRAMDGSSSETQASPRERAHSDLASKSKGKQQPEDSESKAEAPQSAEALAILVAVTVSVPATTMQSAPAPEPGDPAACSARGDEDAASAQSIASPSDALSALVEKGVVPQGLQSQVHTTPCANEKLGASQTPAIPSGADDWSAAAPEGVPVVPRATAAQTAVAATIAPQAVPNVSLGTASQAGALQTDPQVFIPTAAAPHEANTTAIRQVRLSDIIQQVQKLQTDQPASATIPTKEIPVKAFVSSGEQNQTPQVVDRLPVETRLPASAVLSPQPSQAPDSAHHTDSARASANSSATSNSATSNLDAISKSPTSETSADQEEGHSPEKSHESTAPSKPVVDCVPNFAQTIQNSSAARGTSASTPSLASGPVQPVPQGHLAANSTDSSPAQPDPQTSASLPPRLPEVPAAHLVSAAQLVENSGRSEMRIEFQTDRLGNVQLHARIAGDEVGAAIAVEKRDAHAVIAVELPALQQALSAKQLRVDNVILSQGSLGSPAGDAGRNSQQQAATTNRYSNNPSWAAAPKYLSASRHDTPLSGIFDTQGRLNVHA